MDENLEKGTTDGTERQILKRQGEEIQAKAKRLAEKASSDAKAAAEASDIGHIAMVAAEYGYLYADWKPIIENMQRLDTNLTRMLVSNEYSLYPSSSTTSSGSAVLSGIANLTSSQYYPFMSPVQLVGAKQTNYEISNFFTRHHMRGTVIEELKQFGVREIVAKKFDFAWEAFEQCSPETDVALSALITMRISLEKLIDDLYQRRPDVRNVRKPDKVLEIGRQLMDGIVDREIFVDLSMEYSTIHNLLCGGKDQGYDRDRQGELLLRSTFFISTFLGLLDPMKLKPRK